MLSCAIVGLWAMVAIVKKEDLDCDRPNEDRTPKERRLSVFAGGVEGNHNLQEIGAVAAMAPFWMMRRPRSTCDKVRR